LALEFREEGSNLTGTSAAKRMAQSDGTTLGVDLLNGDVALLDSVNGLGSKSFVQLEDVNIIDLEASTLNSNGDGESRSNTHNVRGNTNHSGSDILAQDGKTKLVSGLTLHQENSGSTVRDLGSVTSSSGTVSLESWLELGKGLGRSSLSHTLILINNNGLFVTILVNNGGGDRNNFILEVTSLLGSDGLGV
jgi:hypothetical protein